MSDGLWGRKTTKVLGEFIVPSATSSANYHITVEQLDSGKEVLTFYKTVVSSKTVEDPTFEFSKNITVILNNRETIIGRDYEDLITMIDLSSTPKKKMTKEEIEKELGYSIEIIE